MLSEQENQLLTQTGPDNAMGKMFRRFWLPALLPSELPETDCAPIRFRILGEDLVAFRDSNGKVGFVDQNCPHRGASLFYGRNEESGLRCVYHGWKFNVEGDCVDMPSEPFESNFKDKIRTVAYPSAEFGGLVWIYMGPPDLQPDLPQYEWTTRGANPKLRVYKWMQESNYAQALEGNIDTAHVNFLHRSFKGVPALGRHVDPDAAPHLQLHETDFGFTYGGRRIAEDGRYYWRVTPFVLPSFTSIPSQTWDGSGIFVIPMDDYHCWWFTISPSGTRMAAGAPEHEYVELLPHSWRQTLNQENDYGIDREMQRSHNYTGLPGNRVQDAMVTESMGPIYDRRREHLGTSDKAIIFMRNQLMRLAKELEEGAQPAILRDSSLFRVRPVDVVTGEPNLWPIWQADHAAHIATPAFA
jgi:phenylpropionate dioxygenase-like ring-hydroxylating dioxygenase large terminal subunit